MPAPRRLIVVLLLPLVLGACSGPSTDDATPDASPAPTVTVTATATVTATPQAPDPPDKLALNKWAQLEAMKTRVTKYSEADASSSDDERTVSALVESCVTGGEAVSLSWDPWSAFTADGSRFPALGSTYGDYPKPEYPFAGDETYKPGECVKGWIVFSSPKKPEMTSIRYSNDAGEVATWTL